MVKGQLVKISCNIKDQFDKTFKVEKRIKNKAETSFVSKMFGKVISEDDFVNGKYLQELDMEGFCFNTFHANNFKDDAIVLLDTFEVYNNQFTLCYVDGKFVRFHMDIIKEIN